MLRWMLAAVLVSTIAHPASSQSFGDWLRQPYGPRGYDSPPDYRLRSYPYERERRPHWLEDDEPHRYRSDLERRLWEDQDPRDRIPDRGLGPAILDGGPRPGVRPLPPTQIAFDSSYLPGSIVIDTAGRKLYLVQSPTSTLVYPISVGGFQLGGHRNDLPYRRLARLASTSRNAAERPSPPRKDDGRRTKSSRRQGAVPWEYPLSHPWHG